MQIAMFLVLGLLVYPSHLFAVAASGFLLSAFLIFVARPIAVFTSLFGPEFNLREKAMISFVGLRGSVPIILSTYVLEARIDRADEIYHLVFFTVLTSVLIQGAPIPWVARILRVDAPSKPKFRYPIEYVPTGDMRSELVEVEVPRDSPAAGKSVIELALPKDVLIVLIQRKGRVIVPKGSTQLEGDDTMLVLAEPAVLEMLRKLISGNQ
jgi:cell volume regulation protein A